MRIKHLIAAAMLVATPLVLTLAWVTSPQLVGILIVMSNNALVITLGLFGLVFFLVSSVGFSIVTILISL
jgi:hypothetical protein